MAVVAICFALLYVLVVFLVEPLLLRRRTGRSAWLATWGATGWERAANVMFVAGCGLDLVHPVLAAVGVLQPITLPAPAVVITVVAGLVFAASLALAVRAQHVMNGAWRTGITPDEATDLVTHGPFRLMCNPTYTSLLACSITVAALVPTPLAAAAVLVCAAALQIQTRLVEEPHLQRRHGQVYERYAAGVGRFVPGVGRL